MSLIGSLEDLSLGDILQIISLSRKSGVLVLRTDEGEGRIVFRSGLVCGAAVKGFAEDLRSVLVSGGFLEASAFDDAVEVARREGRSIEEVLTTTRSLTIERIESLRREAIETAVVRMFTWCAGEFSFDVREELEPDDPPLLLANGVNAQYLAMEAARCGDESERDGSDLPAHEMFGVEPAGDASADPDAAATGAEDQFSESAESEQRDQPDASIPAFDPAAPPDPSPEQGIADPARAAALETVALAAARAEEPSPESAEQAIREPALATAPPAARRDASQPIVVIDPDLGTLEWAKQVLSEGWERVHIFQRSELGLARIRQYLARTVVPVVLLSPETPGDRLSGIVDASDFVRRLKVQAPRLRVLWLHEDGCAPLDRTDPADGVVLRPAEHQLVQDRHKAQLLQLGSAMCGAIDRCNSSAETGSGRPGGRISPAALAGLKEATQRLREASTRGEVLPLVIFFASEMFSRVAMFMVRDDSVTGMAGSGLELAGGPDDAGLRCVRMAVDESAWFRRVLQSGAPSLAPASNEGDAKLSLMLGDREPPQAYVAPIESGGRAVALVYADNLPSGEPISDTSAFEVVLHHAGLALDRAALERALAEAEAEGRPDAPEGD